MGLNRRSCVNRAGDIRVKKGLRGFVFAVVFVQMIRMTNRQCQVSSLYKVVLYNRFEICERQTGGKLMRALCRKKAGDSVQINVVQTSFNPASGYQYIIHNTG